MPELIHCPSCNRQLRVPEELIGKHVKCPECNEKFVALLGSITTPESPAWAQPEDAPKREPGKEYDAGSPPFREKPGKVQAIGIMTLIGGILAVLVTINWCAVGIVTGGICCLWPGTYYSLVLGIMAITRGSRLLGSQAHNCPAPYAIAIMQIINIVNGDVPNLVMGIITLVFLNEPELQRYFRR